MTKTAKSKQTKGPKASAALSGTTPAELAALRVIAASIDAPQLRRFQENAKRAGSDAVGRAASRRLIDILPARASGSLDDDFRRTVLAFEELHAQEGGKPARPSRARPKGDRGGAHRAIVDVTTAAAPTDGFNKLLERGFPEMTAEAIVLRHRGEFSDDVIAAATRRLADAGIDVAALPTS